MFILEIAFLVATFNAILGKTAALVILAMGLVAVSDLLTGPLAGEERPLRRFLKQERQYTGLPGLSRKGTVVNVLQSAHAVRFARRDGRGLVERDLRGMRE
ncbi:MAG: hypothetical protein OXI94_13915 [Gemmatimonadota bacterium]|nr:hypothetical protein [Gemmatimonadota bacterium]MDE2831487.1 hypothetical protein [Gemmatimonadota bacterium]MDE2953825.1 hypothetical protein [Gemmatimonadota bacterium]